MDFQAQANYAQPQQPVNNISSEKMMLWSQPTGYMIDSGYTTQAPSISSINDFLNDEHMEVPHQQHHHQQQQQQQQRAPEPVQWQNHSMPQHQQQQQPQMQQPSQQHQPVSMGNEFDQNSDGDNAIQDWMNNGDNTEAAIKAIPEILKLLNDEDHVIASQAASLVHQMSKRTVSCMALIETPETIPSLVNCLANEATAETAKNVVGAFYNISMNKMGVQAIVSANAVQTLVNLLSVPLDCIVSYAITSLHNVMLAFNEAKALVRKLGAVQKLVPLMTKSQSAKFQTIVVDCLTLLAQQNQETKKVVHDMGGPEILVEVLKKSAYPKLSHVVIKLLKALSVCTLNKKALVNAGAVHILGSFLAHKSLPTETMNNCLMVLRNLSDMAAKHNGLEGLIDTLVKILAGQPDMAVANFATGCLTNFTCGNESSKIAAVRSNVIPVIIRLIENSISNTELVDACMCILRHLSHKHAESAKAQEQIRANNGIQLAANLMTMQPRKWSVIKPTLGLLRNLAGSAINMQLIKSCFMLEKLMHVMFDAFSDLQRGVNVHDDIKMVDMVEASCNLLLAVIKDYQNQMFLKDFNCIPFIVQLFYSPVQGIQRLSASILCELVKNKDCAEVIEQQPGLQQVCGKYLANYMADGQLAELTNQLKNGLQEMRAAKMRQQFAPAPWAQPNPTEFYQQQQQQQQQQQHDMFFNQQQTMQQETFIQQQQPYDGFTRL